MGGEGKGRQGRGREGRRKGRGGGGGRGEREGKGCAPITLSPRSASGSNQSTHLLIQAQQCLISTVCSLYQYKSLCLILVFKL